MGAPPTWRQWPSSTRVQADGCYAYQVDGVGFSEVIVFQAVAQRPADLTPLPAFRSLPHELNVTSALPLGAGRVRLALGGAAHLVLRIDVAPTPSATPALTGPGVQRLATPIGPVLWRADARRGGPGVAVWDDGPRRYRLDVLDGDAGAWSVADLRALVAAFAAAPAAGTPAATPAADAALLATCPMPTGVAISGAAGYFAPWGLGGSPVWLVGFGSPPEQYWTLYPHVPRHLPYLTPGPRDPYRPPHGWPRKALWEIAFGTTATVTFHGARLGENAPPWFQLNGGPVTTWLVLDPRHPGAGRHDGWREFPSSLFFPNKTGCYELAASWQGGSWTVRIPFVAPVAKATPGAGPPS